MKLAVNGLRFSFGAREVLKGLDLDADRGLVGVLGPNGSGKTTLIRCVAGLLRPDDGTVKVMGDDIFRLDRREVARRVSVVSQTSVMEYGFSVEETVLMGRLSHASRLSGWSALDRAAAERAMKASDIWNLRERPVTELSGGEAQMVALARALAQQAPVMLLDEPTAHLDISHQLRVLSTVREQLGDDGLALAAIHDVNLAARFCDEVVLLRDGAVLERGPPLDVYAPGLLGEVYGLELEVRRHPETGVPYVLPSGPSWSVPDAPERT